MTVDDSTISDNVANRAGGGIEFVTGIAILTNSHVDGNTSGLSGVANPGRGGGLHVSGSGGRVTIYGGTVSGNHATQSGGGLWNDGGNTMIIRTGTVIDGNSASGDDPLDGGGGIFNNGGRLVAHPTWIVG